MLGLIFFFIDWESHIWPPLDIHRNHKLYTKGMPGYKKMGGPREIGRRLKRPHWKQIMLSCDNHTFVSCFIHFTMGNAHPRVEAIPKIRKPTNERWDKTKTVGVVRLLNYFTNATPEGMHYPTQNTWIEVKTEKIKTHS